MQVNISTMNKSADELLILKKVMNLEQVPVLFINQCSSDRKVQLEPNTTALFTTSKGLSKSRNLGIEHAQEDIILLGDDDLIYYDHFDQMIEQAFKENPDYSVICFRTNRQNTFLKNKKERIHSLNMTSVYSVQTAFRRKDILDSEIRFNEYFGSGSGYFLSGEENLFVQECLNKGLKCLYLPIKILEIPESQSTWFTGFNKEYFVAKGALLFKLYGHFSFIMSLAFILLKYPKYKENLSVVQVIKAMKEGKEMVMNLEGNK